MSIDLTQLNSIAGVTDAFIYSKGGQLLVPQLQYKDARIEQFGREVALCSAILEKMKQEVDFIELIYVDRHLIVQISQNFFILVVCNDSTDTTLIKLTLNVLSNEVKGDKEIQKSLRKLPAQTDLLVKAQEESGLQELFKKLKITA
jgi:predicted regulator of Ras-like GTPase activity (Roadblock/LC7/MglB family)